MKITTIGRGNIGGGLGDLWRRAGHEVVEFGREGGDCSASEAVLLAVPQAAIADALAGVSGLEGVPVIDAVNVVRGGRPEGFESLAEYVRSLTGGPVAKAFNANFGSLYDRIEEARATPSMVYAADDGARGVRPPTPPSPRAPHHPPRRPCSTPPQSTAPPPAAPTATHAHACRRHRPIRRRHHQDRPYHLRRTRNHILDIVRMTRTYQHADNAGAQSHTPHARSRS